MKNISYELLQEFINKRCSDFSCEKINIIDERSQKSVLKKFLDKYKVEDIHCNNGLSRITFDNLDIINYDVVKEGLFEFNYPTLEHHCLISNEEEQVLEVSQVKNMGNHSGIIYDQWKLFDENRRILYLMSVTSKVIHDHLIQKQIVLTEKDRNSNIYITKHYDFIYQDDICMILGVDNEYYATGTNLFMNRELIANNHIQRVETILNTFVHKSFGLEEPTKRYEIKRKKR